MTPYGPDRNFGGGAVPCGLRLPLPSAGSKKNQKKTQTTIIRRNRTRGGNLRRPGGHGSDPIAPSCYFGVGSRRIPSAARRRSPRARRKEEEESQRLLLGMGLLLLPILGLLLFLAPGLLFLLALGPLLLLMLGLLLLLLALGLLLLLESKREEEECQRKKDRQVGGSLERGVQNGGIFVRFLATVNT